MNQLSDLPPEIGKLTDLLTLWLNNNPLVTPPIDIATNGISAIREYFASLKEQETEITKNYDVFICHSSKDKDFIIKKILPRLKKRGITYWIDNEQIKYDHILNKIEDGLQNSKHVMVCLSKNLGTSNWCRAEYGAVLHKTIKETTGKKVIPLKLDDCDEKDIPLLLYDIERTSYGDKKSYEKLLDFLSKP
ncbi:toll/interleukin-1 receptor domain-containing protein [Candidatus Magnetomonas plexicatena]|nr:toll/interleukin-1 receptor domain-containing protein [Nitrospirales bacterium LBB_01]